MQRQAARFITGDYKSRNQGCVTDMLTKLKLPPLQDHRRTNRLIFLFKVAEGLVPALPPTEYLSNVKPKRRIKAKQFKDCNTSNIIDNQVINHDRGFAINKCKTVQLKNSSFIKKCQDWNHLDSSVISAKTVEGFKSALRD